MKVRGIRWAAIVAVVWGLGAPATASAQVPVAYTLGAGAVIPIGGVVSERLTTGVHVDGGVYFKFLPMLSAGLHVGFDLPFGQQDPNNTFEHEARFTGISARGMYTFDFVLGHFWTTLGAGLYFNKLTSCTREGLAGCGEESVSQFGVNADLGVNFKLWSDLSVGPAVGVVFPSVANFGDQMLLTAAARFHWGF